MNAAVYKSKFGFAVVGFLTVTFASILAFMLIQGEPAEAILSVAAVFLLVEGLIIYLNFSIEYVISADGYLNIRVGFLSSTSIDIREIKSVAKTRSWLSSPAPSLDRIMIKYGRSGSLIISPKNKAEFARDLKKINPEIDNQLDIGRFSDEGTTQQFSV